MYLHLKAFYALNLLRFLQLVDIFILFLNVLFLLYSIELDRILVRWEIIIYKCDVYFCNLCILINNVQAIFLSEKKFQLCPLYSRASISKSDELHHMESIL